MEEKLYKKMKSVGVSNLVFGIVTIAFSLGAKGKAFNKIKKQAIARRKIIPLL